MITGDASAGSSCSMSLSTVSEVYGTGGTITVSVFSGANVVGVAVTISAGSNTSPYRGSGGAIRLTSGSTGDAT